MIFLIKRVITGSTEFIAKLREALECDQVSSTLHHWIDLIFGCKQNGEEADKADNSRLKINHRRINREKKIH